MKRMIDEKLYAKKEQEAWITPTLLNGWTDNTDGYAPFRYYKDSLGIVHIEGVIKGGTENVICVLPSGYRGQSNIIPIIMPGTTQPSIRVYPNGTLYVSSIGAVNYFINISYRAVS